MLMFMNTGWFELPGLLLLAFTAWMVVDCALHEPPVGNEKLVWILVNLFVPLIGPLAYYALRRPERMRQFGR